MNGGTHVIPGRPHAARTAAAALTMAVLALLAAACSGGGRSSAGASGAPGGAAASAARSPSAVAYAACMRSHGVPTYPDPDPARGGSLPKTDAQRLGVSSTRYAAAQQACRSLLPDASGSFNDQVRQCYLAGNCPPALVQQMLTVGRKVAQCMRSHGVPSWPDPTLDSAGRPFFDLSGHGFTSAQWHAPAMRSKEGQCSEASGGGLATG